MTRNKTLPLTVLTLFLCVLLFLERLTGDVAHALLGLVLIVLLAVHLCRRAAAWRSQKPAIRIVDSLLLALLVGLLLTGLLLHPFHGAMVVKCLHKLFSLLFVVGIVVHVVQHKRNTATK
jgi:hypothetical protein